MLPSRTDPRWTQLVEHPERFTYQFLALRILMQRIARQPGTQRSGSVGELQDFFQKHEALLKPDIAAIFG